MRRNLKSLIPLILLAACEVGPDYRSPKINMPVLNAQEDIAEFITQKWWSVFSDTTLNSLEEQALKYNVDLKQAIAHVDIARAEAGEVFANLVPSISMSGEATESFKSKRGSKYIPIEGAKRSTTYYSADSSISYELDFFGKYRRANEAAQALLLSTRAAKESVLLAVTSEVAKTYFLLRALDAKLAIARRTLQTRQETCRVYKSRLKNGYCTEFDYLRVESGMSLVNITVLDLEMAIAKAENAMSILVGTSPREMIGRKTAKNQAIEKIRIPLRIPKGIPSDILARRPDILQAEGQLIAANAQIGIARASYFPSISLTGMFGFESNSLSRLFNKGSDTWAFNQGISLPIFAGGRISSMNKAAEANYKRVLANYEKSIQNAFRETLDALVSNRKNREIVICETRRVEALKRGYFLARKQKEAGLIGLIDLLDVERELLSAEMALVGALQNQLTSVVDLCKALGGGWKKN
ncbi:MAG: efflux transporter outer membrane subunit [Holosporaceae bacterium]|jgi:multidrug efflux system outer membrane protein|nr:efflux transporter outer membrane subunit [Holosporaceae bacterium]